ncbi:MAG: sulfurtransferase TusA family protein [Candidatus Lokiarchaeota archaeon]|jgi:tRNA 2-thiouridine synthesizing protein A
MPLNNHMGKEDIIERIDIRGELCPMTFVLTKLALEDLPSGHTLEVLLDFPSALKNIPENCKRQGLAEILEIKEVKSSKNEWLLKLKKL